MPLISTAINNIAPRRQVMHKIFSKTSLSVSPWMGMKFISALMLASLMFSNIIGGVQARAESRDVSGLAVQKKSVVANAVYVPPFLIHPEPRIERHAENSIDLSSDNSEFGLMGTESFNTPPFQTPNCQTNSNWVILNGDTCSLAAGVYTFNSIVVNGTLILVGDPATGLGVTIDATSITVETGGKISADGTGYPGSSQGPGAGGNPNPMMGGGGGYGGIGQNADGAGGVMYGSATAPLDLGSSGGLGRFIGTAIIGSW
jgi:hypothetical protein